MLSRADYVDALSSSTASVGSNTFNTDTLSAPTGPSASGGSTVTMNWTATASTYASGHRVYRSSTSGGSYSQIAQITPRTTVTYSDTPPNGTYYYVVRAYYQNWESANSSEVSTAKTSMLVSTGLYTGNGTAGHAITGVGFQPDVVIIKGDTNQFGAIRTSTMTDTKPIAEATALTSNLITSLDSDGFTLGTGARVNGNNVIYYYVALKSSVGEMKVGTYSGNGTSQSVTGTGFTPDFVLTMSAGAAKPCFRTASASKAYFFDADAGTTTRITSLDSNGFSVGSDSCANSNGTAYHYFAFKVFSGKSSVGTYTGNATDNRNITGLGFQPGYVIVKADAGTAAAHKPSSDGSSLDETLSFTNVANFANGIQSLQSGGFQVGTHASVNSNGVVYYYMAFKDTRTMTNFGSSADSFVDEGNATTNNGTALTMKVDGNHAGVKAKRSFVQFNLSAIPASSTIQSATLTLCFTTISSGAIGHIHELRTATSSWTETGITWNNQPTVSGTATATITVPSTTQCVTVTVTSDVQAWVNGSANDGWRLHDQAEATSGGSSSDYGTRENATASDQPGLSVTYSPP
jgi:hypothetical protein